MKMNEQTDTFITSILCGPALAGKTVFASQFPNPFFLSLDPHVLMSVRALRSKFKLDFDANLFHITDDPTEDPDFLEMCGKAFKNLKAWEKTKRATQTLLSKLSADDTLVIDNVSRISEIVLDYTRREVRRKRLQIQDWNIFIEEITEFFNYFTIKSRKCNVLIVAHDEVRKEELTGDIERMLSIPTKMRGRLPSLATDFLLLTAEGKGPSNARKVVRRLRSAPSMQANTGSRCLIPDIENPTYAKVRPYIEAALGRKLPEPNWTPPEDE